MRFPRPLFASVLNQLVTSAQPKPTLTGTGGVRGCVVGSANPLLGRSVLIVEDEPLIALQLHDALHKAGASILAATSVKDALELIAYAKTCAAIVDVKLGGHELLERCDALAKRSIPFMFYTGYSSAAPLSTWPDAPAVEKPAADAKLVETIVQLLPLER